MNSPNSLLMGFDIIVNGIHTQRWVVGKEACQKRKKTKINIFYRFSCPLDKANDGFLCPVFVLQIQTVLIRTCVCCLLGRGKGHAHTVKNTGALLGKCLLRPTAFSELTHLFHNPSRFVFISHPARFEPEAYCEPLGLFASIIRSLYAHQ